MTRSRKRSKAAAPITAVAAGSLGTAANLDDTQVLKNEDLRAATPARLEDDSWWTDGEDSAPLAGTAGPAEPEPAVTAAPLAAAPAPPSSRPSGGMARQVNRRNAALVGAGALAALFVLAGAGVLSQLDFGTSGAEPTTPALGVTSFPPAVSTPQPQQQSGGGGHGDHKCHGKHCG
jgi:hypothetical protein